MALSYSVACDSDIPAAQQLIRQAYEKQGYLTNESSFQALTGRLLSKQSVTFLSRCDQAPIGTVSVIFGDAAPLPLESIFKNQIASLRANNANLAEVGQLAIDANNLSKKHRFQVLTTLFSLVFHYSVQQQISHLCIAVNPKHEMLYRSLSFSVFGRQDAYKAVGGAPAIGMHLNVRRANSLSASSQLLKMVVRRSIQVDHVLKGFK